MYVEDLAEAIIFLRAWDPEAENAPKDTNGSTSLSKCGDWRRYFNKKIS